MTTLIKDALKLVNVTVNTEGLCMLQAKKCRMSVMNGKHFLTNIRKKVR